jgi:hypothetical protein
MHYDTTRRAGERIHGVQVDIHDIACLIEDELGKLLKPYPEGLYLPNDLEPVMVKGNRYYYETQIQEDGESNSSRRGYVYLNKTSGRWRGYKKLYEPVKAFEDVLESPYDIVRLTDYVANTYQVVLPHHMTKFAMIKPNVPISGVKIALDMMQTEMECTTNIRSIRKPRRSMEEIVAPYLLDRYQDIERLKGSRNFEELMNDLFDASLQMLQAVRDFTAANSYQLCVLRQLGVYTYSLETNGDFRIKEWSAITEDPEYQRWRESQVTGEWDRFLSERERQRIDSASNSVRDEVERLIRKDEIDNQDY